MSVADYEGNGTLDYLERCQLANKLKRWIVSVFFGAMECYKL